MLNNASYGNKFGLTGLRLEIFASLCLFIYLDLSLLKLNIYIMSYARPIFSFICNNCLFNQSETQVPNQMTSVKSAYICLH